MAPKEDVTTSNSESEKGRCSTSASTHSSSTPLGLGLSASRREVLRRQVRGDHPGPSQGGPDCGVAGPGRHVEDPLAGVDLTGIHQYRPHLPDSRPGEPVVVAQRPDVPHRRLQLAVGVGLSLGAVSMVVSVIDLPLLFRSVETPETASNRTCSIRARAAWAASERRAAVERFMKRTLDRRIGAGFARTGHLSDLPARRQMAGSGYGSRSPSRPERTA